MFDILFARQFLTRLITEEDSMEYHQVEVENREQRIHEVVAEIDVLNERIAA